MTTLERVRSDRLPENVNVANGCVAHDDCLTCPFPECIAVSCGPTGSPSRVNSMKLKRLKRSGMYMAPEQRRQVADMAAEMARHMKAKEISARFGFATNTTATYIGIGVRRRDLGITGHRQEDVYDIIQSLKGEGWSIEEISEVLCCSVRTIQREIQAGPPEFRLDAMQNRPVEEPPDTCDTCQGLTSGSTALFKQRAPLPEIRPGLSNTRVVYQRSLGRCQSRTFRMKL